MDNDFFKNLNVSLSSSFHLQLVNKVEALPSFKKLTKYYNEPNIYSESDEPYWITINESKFSILENSHLYFGDELNKLIAELRPLTEILPSDFKLCKTEGNIQRHIDHGRLTSINYYIRTRGEKVDFETKSLVPEVNQTYALNVQMPHSIHAFDEEPRFFFSAWVQKSYRSLFT